MLMPSIPAASHMLSGRWLARFLPVALFLLIATSSWKESVAQTVQVDATPSHVVNKFSPLYALGTTVDRVPSNATDMFFRPDQLKQVLSAGWGSVSYRQNTELFVQAWHWNPKGKWSDPSGKGYFTGDATPTKESIRHSYGYSLQHRGFTRNGGTEFDGFSRLDDGDLNTYWKSNPYLTQGFTGEDRFSASAMGGDRSGHEAGRKRHPHYLDRTICPRLPGAVLDRRRRHGRPGQR